MEIRIKEGCITEKGKKLLNGWEHWSLEDINRTLKVMECKVWGVCVCYLGQIIFNVLLKAANDPKISFEAIKETSNKTLDARTLSRNLWLYERAWRKVLNKMLDEIQEPLQQEAFLSR